MDGSGSIHKPEKLGFWLAGLGVWYACFTSAVHSLHKLMVYVHLRIWAFCRFVSNLLSSLLSAASTDWYITSKSPGCSLTGTHCTFPALSAHVSAASEVFFLYATLCWFCPFSLQGLFSCSSVACSRAKLSLFGVSVLGCCWQDNTKYMPVLGQSWSFWAEEL